MDAGNTRGRSATPPPDRVAIQRGNPLSIASAGHTTIDEHFEKVKDNVKEKCSHVIATKNALENFLTLHPENPYASLSFGEADALEDLVSCAPKPIPTEVSAAIAPQDRLQQARAQQRAQENMRRVINTALKTVPTLEPVKQAAIELQRLRLQAQNLDNAWDADLRSIAREDIRVTFENISQHKNDAQVYFVTHQRAVPDNMASRNIAPEDQKIDTETKFLTAAIQTIMLELQHEVVESKYEEALKEPR